MHQIKRFKVQHSISDYTLPVEAHIHEVWFDETRIYIELTDGRALAIPLWWIPTLHEAAAEERGKYTINRSRTMILWDPNNCAINDELRLTDYLGPCQPLPQE